MNTFTPYIAGASCILKRGDRADHRMTELNELIASAKGSSVRAFPEAFFVSYNTQRGKKFKVKKRGGPKRALAIIRAGVVAFKKKPRK
jgi:hypothetical protein